MRSRQKLISKNLKADMARECCFEKSVPKMAVNWLLLLFTLVSLTQGKHVPEQYLPRVQNAQGQSPQPDGIQLARVPLAHAPQNSVAICRLESSAGHQVSGDIVLRQTNPQDPVEITGSISGLSQGYHGFHIHQNPDVGDNCKAAGPHFNPDKKSHGAPQDENRHAGDLGNIPVDGDGTSTFQIIDNLISLFENHPRKVVNRAIVVHQKQDDLGRGNDEESKKTGNAGARVACCVIEPIKETYK